MVALTIVRRDLLRFARAPVRTALMFALPLALAGIFAAQVVGESNYFRVLRYCLVPALFELAMGIGVLLLSPFLDKII